MARPREFDEAVVLTAAMECFWAQGYEATSVRTLAGRMGITGASLYNAFGDKRSLYRRALDRYLEQSVQRIGRLERLAPAEAIDAFFGEIVERSVNDEQRRGCLLVNSALETPACEPELQAVIARQAMVIEAFFRGRLTAGQGDGTITRRQSADDLARMLLGVLFGIRVLARTRPDRDVLEGAVRGALGLLRP